MHPFNVDAAGLAVTVDFSVNLPVMVWTRFGVWDADRDLVASSKTLEATPRGVPDFAFRPTLKLPGLLLCRFECIGPSSLIGELLEVRVDVAQGDTVEAFDLTPTAMLKGGDAGMEVSELRKEVVIQLVRA